MKTLSFTQMVFEAKIMNKKWTNIEIKILEINYPNGGAKACSDKLCRTKVVIIRKAKELGLVAYGVQGGRKRQPIKELNNNKVIAFCPKHGNVSHYGKHERFRCVKCEREQFQKWSQRPSSKIKMRNSARIRLQKPINMYKNRLRGTLYYCFKGTKGFTKNLPYSSKELCDHIEKIRLKQNNQCPMCKDSYDNTGFDIDHIIPLSSTSNESKLLALFNLENLSLLCPKCNRWVKRDRLLLVEGR